MSEKENDQLKGSLPLSKEEEKKSVEMAVLKKLLLQRRSINEGMGEECLSAFRKEFNGVKRKVDISKTPKYINKIKSFTADQFESMLPQLDVLNLSKFDNEISAAVMICLLENKKFVYSDISTLTMYVYEVVRRYPTVGEDLEVAFENHLKLLAMPKMSVNVNAFMVYSELVVSRVLGREGNVGKSIKLINDRIESGLDISSPYYDLIVAFIHLFAFDYCGILPVYASNALLVKEEMKEFNPLLEDSFQSRFSSLVVTLLTTMQRRTDNAWEMYSEAKKKASHEQVFRGKVSEELEESVKKSNALFLFYSDKLREISLYLNHPMKEYNEEDMEIKGGFESLSVVKLSSADEYDGPFADAEEHAFYTNIPDLRELLPPQYFKKETSQEEKKNGDIEKEVADMNDMVYESNGDDDYENEEENAVYHYVKSKRGGASEEEGCSEVKNEEYEHVLNDLMNCYSSESVDKWCLSFCSINTAYSRGMLVDFLRRKYCVRRYQQSFFVRAIKELAPVFPSLGKEMESIAIKRFYRMNLASDASTWYYRQSNADFLSELVRFNISSPSVFFYCLRKLLQYHNTSSYQVVGQMVMKCGRLMLFVEQTSHMMNVELDKLLNLCKNGLIGYETSAYIMDAYYYCRPKERPTVKRVEIPPLQRYLRYLLNEKLAAAGDEKNRHWVVNQIRKYNTQDVNTLLLITQEMLATPRTSYDKINALCMLTAELIHFIPRIGSILIDSLYEEIWRLLEYQPKDSFQNMMCLIEYICGLYKYKILDDNNLFFILYLFIEYGHNVTAEIREKYPSLLPAREMAISPLVPNTYDTPYDCIRLKLAILLLSKTFMYLEKQNVWLYLLYLQRYFLAKAVVDLDTRHDYEALLKDCRGMSALYTSYDEVDTVIAQIEQTVLQTEGVLLPHTHIMVFSTALLPSEGERSVGAPPAKSAEEIEYEKKYELMMKPSVQASTIRSAELTRIQAINSQLTANDFSNGFKLLLTTDRGDVAIGEAVEVNEGTKQMMMREKEKREKEKRKLKKKTLLLTKQQMDDDSVVQQIHNESVSVCPQSRR